MAKDGRPRATPDLSDLNRAFGSRTGDRPRFTAEAEGDEYLFGRPAGVDRTTTHRGPSGEELI